MGARTERGFPARTGVAEVVRVTELTPTMVRITLGGPALADFFVEEPGEILTLMWPAPGCELVLPSDGWRFPPDVARAQHARNYTVRRWTASRRELDIDIALHGDNGRGSRWAVKARPGDRVGFGGPRVHWTSAQAADWTLLVADETGLPALAAIAEELPAGHRAYALVEVAGADEEQRIDTRAELDLRWLHRDGACAGTTRLLSSALRALRLPAGRGRAWGGRARCSATGSSEAVPAEPLPGATDLAPRPGQSGLPPASQVAPRSYSRSTSGPTRPGMSGLTSYPMPAWT